VSSQDVCDGVNFANNELHEHSHRSMPEGGLLKKELCTLNLRACELALVNFSSIHVLRNVSLALDAEKLADTSLPMSCVPPWVVCKIKVYAAAIVKFLDHKAYLLEQRLNMILALPESTTYEGETKIKENTTLNSLYTSILQMALDFGKEDPGLDSKIQSIFGAVVLVVNPLPPSAVAELISLEAKQVRKILTLVQSLLVFYEDPNSPVKPFHKSFPDFITDPSCCLNKRFYISPSIHHHELTIGCLRLMNGALKPNLLSLPDYTLNREVRDLPDRVKKYICPALEYACRSWHNHLVRIEKGEDSTCVLDALRIFLKQKFLPWLEVVSVLEVTRDAAVALRDLIQWFQEVCSGLL